MLRAAGLLSPLGGALMQYALRLPDQPEARDGVHGIWAHGRCGQANVYEIKRLRGASGSLEFFRRK